MGRGTPFASPLHVIAIVIVAAVLGAAQALVAIDGVDAVGIAVHAITVAVGRLGLVAPVAVLSAVHPLVAIDGIDAVGIAVHAIAVAVTIDGRAAALGHGLAAAGMTGAALLRQRGRRDSNCQARGDGEGRERAQHDDLPGLCRVNAWGRPA